MIKISLRPGLLFWQGKKHFRYFHMVKFPEIAALDAYHLVNWQQHDPKPPPGKIMQNWKRNQLLWYQYSFLPDLLCWYIKFSYQSLILLFCPITTTLVPHVQQALSTIYVNEVHHLGLLTILFYSSPKLLFFPLLPIESWIMFWLL